MGVEAEIRGERCRAGQARLGARGMLLGVGQAGRAGLSRIGTPPPLPLHLLSRIQEIVDISRYSTKCSDVRC